MYRLIATIDGSRVEQGVYAQLNHLASRILQLDTEFEFLKISRPTEYEIFVLK